jgi:hypothetical protein
MPLPHPARWRMAIAMLFSRIDHALAVAPMS